MSKTKTNLPVNAGDILTAAVAKAEQAKEAPLTIKAIRCTHAIAMNATVSESVVADAKTTLEFHAVGVIIRGQQATKLIPFANLKEIHLA